jgi:hypothetical protein
MAEWNPADPMGIMENWKSSHAVLTRREGPFRKDSQAGGPPPHTPSSETESESLASLDAKIMAENRRRNQSKIAAEIKDV